MKATLLNNRYRIIKTLGRGGFGETYLAEDTHMPSGRKCVLKQLKPIVKQPKTPLWMKERFQREAAILEELGNGNSQIPQLYAYFSEGDKFYLVQEWIEGLTLDCYWEREGNLHRDEVRQILLQLLPVLEYVHSRHIIHRDIKPENIILRQGDNLPFLIDFGAVKEAIATEVVQSGSTYSASIGTPGYMSSEQAAGRPIYSSDLYSLGLTAIFLLTGKSPNELETDPRTGEIIWREHAFNLDPKLAEVIDRAICFHPRDRFATARAMLDALAQETDRSRPSQNTGFTLNVAPHRTTAGDRASNRGDTMAYPEVYPERTKKPKKRSLLATVGLFALIATGVAVGTFTTGFIVISSLLRSPEPAPEEPARRQPDLFSNSQIESGSEEESQPTTTANRQTERSAERSETEQNGQNARNARLTRENTEPEATASADKKPPKTLAKVDLGLEENELDLPILTTGTSESQLVSTLGQPNSERRGWQPNSRVLVYYDVIPERVNLSYQADDTGRIRQTDVALDRSVSLNAMEQTLAQLLGGEAPAGIREKLRSVYNNRTTFSFFKLNNLEGKVQRDARNRINISVWERGYQ